MALIAVIPALVVIAYTQTIERRDLRERTIEENRRIMLLAASQQAAVFEGAARLLSTLAEFTRLRDADPARCRELLPTVLRGNPGYINLWVSSLEGTILCAALDAQRVPDQRTRPWFQRALATRATAVGDYQISLITGKPAVIVAQPLLDEAGNVQRMLAATLGLDQLNRLAAAAKLPAGATLTLFDRRRIILARYPDGERWLGNPLPESIPVAGLDSDVVAGSTAESPGVDGVRRLYMTTPVEGSIETGLFVAMGIDAQVAFAQSNVNLRRELGLIAAVALVTGLIALFGGEAFVLRPVQALVAAANRIAAGDFTARSQLVGGAPGIAEISDAVNAMAGSLEAREQQLREQSRISALLADVGGALNEPGPLWPPLQSCAQALVHHVDAVVVRIWTLNSRENVLELQASAGILQELDASDGRIAVGDSPIGRIARDRVPQVVDDITGADVPDREWAIRDGLVTFVAHPLIVHHRVVGVLAAFARQPWSDSVKAAFSSAAAHLALGIERHHAEQARRRLATIVEESDDAVYSETNDGIILTWNDAAAKLYGYTADEIIGQSVGLIIPPDRGHELTELLARLRAGEHLKHYETVCRRKDGADVAVSLTLSPIRDEAGVITGASAIARDITERQEAERTFRNAEERTRFALETSGTGVWEADIKTGVNRWSPTLERLHGLEPGSFGGTLEAFVAAIHPDDRKTVYEAVERATRNRTDSSVEYRVVWPDGTERWISSIGHFSYDEAGEPQSAAGVAIDVTAKHLLEDQLRQAQKMDAVGQLAGGIAHDFNNMLTAIQGHAYFLIEDLKGDPLRAEADAILKTSQRAGALTQQLLAFSRKQVLTTRVLRLGDVVADLVPMLRRLIGERIDLKAVTTDRGHLKADAVQLEQVLINLVVNARDAMPEHGILTVETADVTLDTQAASRFPSLRPGPHVVLTVKDTGCGMDEGTRSHVFEPFFTTKPKGQGTGLGLSTVYGIVRQSGGAIMIASEVNRGSKFTIHLPCTDEPLSATPNDPPTRTTRGTETILLVEDEEAVRELVAKILSRLGYTVHAMPLPSAAIDFSKNYRSPIHLLVSDVMLPEMHGAAVAAAIVQQHPETRVLLMSGYTDGVFGPGGILDKNTPFLQKPFSAKGLAEKVRETLEADPTRA